MSGIPGVDVPAILALAVTNADYETANSGAGDAAKCLLFIGAVNQLLIAVAQRQQQGGVNRTSEVEFDLAVWERRLAEARSWQQANGAETNIAESRVRHLGFGAWR